MAADDPDLRDFAAYLAVRWAPVVRSLVLLGCPAARAAEVAEDGFARCLRSWRRSRSGDDADVLVHREALARWQRGRRGRRPSGRAALVLQVVGGLDVSRVAEVLDVAPGMVAGLLAIDAPAEDLHAAAEEIAVPAAPYDAVVSAAREQRRRVRRTTAASVTAAVLVAGVLGWVAARSPDGAAASRVVRQANPADVVWYAVGRLHLPEVVVDVPDVTAVAAVGGGAVYLDHRGRVGLVDADGVRTVVGAADPTGRVLASTEKGWAAWVDTSGARPRLVVYDVRRGEQLAERDVGAGAEAVAIDRGRIYYRTPAAAFAWPPDGRVDLLPRADLLDVSSATTVYQRGRGLDVVGAGFAASRLRPGEGAELSPDGDHLLTRAPGRWSRGTPYRPILYDTVSGRRLPGGVRHGELALDAAFGPHGDVTYLISSVADLQSPPDLDGHRSVLATLRTCELVTGQCRDVVPVPTAGQPALLAHQLGTSTH